MMVPIGRFRALSVAVVLSAALACGSQSQTAPAPAPKPAAKTDSSTIPAPLPPVGWLVVDSAARTARITLVVTGPPNSPSALINDSRSGQARLTVPLGWTVQWDWRNADSGSAHSLVAMVQREKIPLEGGRPSFSNAMTRMVTEGLPPGQTDRTTFEAEEAGWYWMLCGVPGHALKGEWIELRVDPGVQTASVQIPSVNGER